MPSTPDRTTAHRQLQRLAAHPLLARSERLVAFLRFTLDEFYAGRGDQLKEYTVATRVYERKPPYDPRLDSVVRVEARRLRQLLERYYAGDGASDPVVITYPKGGYAPHLEWRSAPAAVKEPLPGRDKQLSALREVLHRSDQGHPQLVFLRGEAGMGKTRLLDVFRQENEDTGVFLRGQCIEGFGGSEAYYPILEAFASLASGGHREFFLSCLRNHAPTWLSQFPNLAETPVGPEYLDASRQRMVREFLLLLESLSVKLSLVLLLEDLHWADSSSIGLLSAIARSRQPLRLLVVASHRGLEEYPLASDLRSLRGELAVQPQCLDMNLPPLTLDDVKSCLNSRSLQLTDAPWLHQRSGGNPLFLQELMTAEGAQAELPESLRQLIEVSLQRLSPQLLAGLEVASCLGDSFPVDLVARVAEVDEDLLDEALLQCPLVCAGSESDYQFTHTLHREVLYRRQSSRQRRTRHRKLAQNLDPTQVSATALAQHYERGGQPEMAIGQLIQASTHAAGKCAYPEALSALQHALELVVQLPQETRCTLEVEVLRRQVFIYQISRDPGVLPPLERLLAIGDMPTRIEAFLERAFYYSFVSRQHCLESVSQVVELAKSIADPARKAAVSLCACYWTFYAQGWNAKDAIQAHESYHILLESGRLEYYAPGLTYYGYVLWTESRFQESAELLKESRRLLLQRELPYLSLAYRQAHTLLGWSLIMDGQLALASSEIRSSFERAQLNGDVFRQALVRALDTYLNLMCCNYTPILAAYAELSEQEHSQGAAMRGWHAMAGLAFLATDQHERGLRALRAAQICLDDPQAGIFFDWHIQIMVNYGLCTHAWQVGEPVETHFEELGQQVEATAERTWKALVWELGARLSKDSKIASERIEKALQLCEGLNLIEWRIHATAAELRAGSSHGVRAQRGLQALCERLPEKHACHASLQEAYQTHRSN